MKRYRKQTYWTRERVLTGLRRFYCQKKAAPSSSEHYRILAECVGKGRFRYHPSFTAVLRFFPTFREAWTAAGVEIDRTHEDWTPLEDWYLREAAGLISRKEIAADLRRTPDAVHRRLYDLELHSYRIHGWNLRRIGLATGVKHWQLQDWVARGILPARRGTRCFYVDPADLVGLPGVDWGSVDGDLEQAVRRALLGQLAGELGRISQLALEPG